MKSKESKELTQMDQVLTDFIKEGQSGKYIHFVRQYTGRIRVLLEYKGILTGSLMVDDINYILEIFNPELKKEIAWFRQLQKELKLWCNEKIITNRLLGIKNDNEYDTRIFEKVVVEKFFMKLNGKPLKPETLVETDFKTMVELVEMGARRFGF